MTTKPQRIRDPLHNLITFDTTALEQSLWKVVQSESFQRLRRIKQLGFSEQVYPGATHTRFSHSLGVYHIAKKLLHIIRENFGSCVESRMEHALTAALVHDVGHGPFSHAFEEVGKQLDISMAKHEDVSDVIIRDGDISKILDDIHGSGFSTSVAKIIRAPGPSQIYGAVVSSQFDADRLDYMQRDRLMTGTQVGSIDFTWLLSNLEIGELPWGDEENQLGTQQTFVLNPKAVHAAEAYILSLFQLYPTVYFHKTTRSAEKIFTQLLLRIFQRVNEGMSKDVGLPSGHPLCKFAKKPRELENALRLDDTVIMGALPLLMEAKDTLISAAATRLARRQLYKCVDALGYIKQKTQDSAKIEARQDHIRQVLQEWTDAKSGDALPRILFDYGKREPYKIFQEEKGPLNQIMIKTSSGPVDISKHSNIIDAIEPFTFFRIYFAENDTEAKDRIHKALEGART